MQFLYNYKNSTNISYATKIENIKKNIKHMKNKNVILVYGNHQHNNIERTNNKPGPVQKVCELIEKKNFNSWFIWIYWQKIIS